MNAKRPTVISRDVSVYLNGDEFIVEHHDGTYSVALTSTDVVKAIKADDAKLSKRKRAIIVTRVTWHSAYITTNARAASKDGAK